MGLKALIIQNEKVRKYTHKLDILFNQLESDEQDYIINNSQYNNADFLDKIEKIIAILKNGDTIMNIIVLRLTLFSWIIL